MPQTILANALGITFQQVQKYENGSNRVSAARLYDISHVLGTPIMYFYDGAEPFGAVSASPKSPRKRSISSTGSLRRTAAARK